MQQNVRLLRNKYISLQYSFIKTIEIMETQIYFYSEEVTYIDGECISCWGTRYKGTKWFIFKKADGYYIGYVENDNTYKSCILNNWNVCSTPIEYINLQGAYATKKEAEHYIYIYVHHEKLK